MKSELKAQLVKFNDAGRILGRQKVFAHACTNEPVPVIEINLDTFEQKHHLSLWLDIASLVKALKKRGAL